MELYYNGITLRPKYIEGHASDDAVCRNCRHANHGTDDNVGGLFFCHFSLGIRLPTSVCDVAIEVHMQQHWLLYEAYDGENGTWQ